MTAATVSKINAAIEKHGAEIVKGAGYFYFSPLPGAAFGAVDHIPSVFTPYLRDLSLDEWVAHVEAAIAEFERKNP